MTLPSGPGPYSVCPACLEGPISARLGLLRWPVEKRWNEDTQRWSWAGGYVYSISPAALLSRAASGCKWCDFVFQRCGYTKQDLEGLREFAGRILRIRTGRMKGEWILRVVVDGVETNSWGYAVSASLDDPAAKRIPRRPRLPDVGSKRTLNLAKACIAQCAREHTRCKASRPTFESLPAPIGDNGDSIAPPHMLELFHLAFPELPQFMPTRLVDCRCPARPRIVLTKGIPRLYVALSYVWGENQPHRATEANLSSYMSDGIDPALLPQTIRDAIHVTHELGIDFLWADSLCIIQDSPEDKHRELVSMRDVYLHAYLTIDAASAGKASDGFLEDRPPLNPWLVLPFDSSRGAVSSPKEIGCLQIYAWSLTGDNSAGQDVLTNSYGRYGTRQRAWCLQETMLSTRSLIFTPWTVQLRCQTMTQNIGGADHDVLGDTPRLPDVVLHSDRRIERYSDEWIDIRERWHNVIEDYSRRKLSYASDKLVACAGLAEMFSRALGSDYAAGLWNDDFLVHDLLWNVQLHSHPRPAEYLAPSWSWAAFEDATVYYHHDIRSSQAIAAVVKCMAVARDNAFPLGPVVSGHLVLQAHLFECTQGRVVPSKHETFVKSPLPEEKAVLLLKESSEVQLSYDLHYKDDTLDEELWATPLVRVRADDGEGYKYSGLLLTPCAKPDIGEVPGSKNEHLSKILWKVGYASWPGVFRRVGYFEIPPRDATKLHWEERSLETATRIELV
ncbi:heterokaryon incompatibility protein-domain-containing protein [Cubamyces lactineus]|nr:heterokaryon incompatibility protein-domain-containing protein [Cubamyces lactineus]